MVSAEDSDTDGLGGEAGSFQILSLDNSGLAGPRAGEKGCKQVPGLWGWLCRGNTCPVSHLKAHHKGSRTTPRAKDTGGPGWTQVLTSELVRGPHFKNGKKELLLQFHS